MSIELSEQATNKLGAVLGTTDPAVIAMLVERLADHGEIVRSLASGELSSAIDVAAVKEGLADVEAGRARPFSEFDAEFRREMGFRPRD